MKAAETVQAGLRWHRVRDRRSGRREQVNDAAGFEGGGRGRAPRRVGGLPAREEAGQTLPCSFQMEPARLAAGLGPPVCKKRLMSFQVAEFDVIVTAAAAGD